jgi:hypothetical protein
MENIINTALDNFISLANGVIDNRNLAIHYRNLDELGYEWYTLKAYYLFSSF